MKVVFRFLKDRYDGDDEWLAHQSSLDRDSFVEYMQDEGYRCKLTETKTMLKAEFECERDAGRLILDEPLKGGHRELISYASQYNHFNRVKKSESVLIFDKEDYVSPGFNEDGIGEYLAEGVYVTNPWW